MKLILRRNQKKGLIASKVIFTLDAHVEVSEEEKQRIATYKMGDTMLCEKKVELEGGSGILAVLSGWWFSRKDFTLSVNDLVRGKHFECKDVVDLLNIEKTIRETSTTFKEILDASAHFGGENVVEL